METIIPIFVIHLPHEARPHELPTDPQPRGGENGPGTGRGGAPEAAGGMHRRGAEGAEV